MSHPGAPARARGVVIGLSTVLILAGASGPLTPEADAASQRMATLRSSVISLTNGLRAAKGCKAKLKANSALTRSAQGHADDMSARHYFSHTSKNGRTWDRRIEKAGFHSPGGENIAYGFDSPASVVAAWVASPGHLRNLLDCKFRRIGVGFQASGEYWVQDFGY